MSRASKIQLISAAVLLLAGVQLGALGAHALDDRLTPRQINNWQLAVQYQLVHALGIMLIIVLREKLINSALLVWAGWSMLAGIILFSGSIYLGSLGTVGFAGQTAPLGGLAFMLAWLLVGMAAMRHR